MSDLQIDRAIRDHLVQHVADWGRMNCETGGFLLANETSPGCMAVLALAGTTGIVRRKDVFSVSSAAIETLFTWAADHELTVRAQVHSHRGDAFLSHTDLQYGFSVEGFTTSVIPTYVTPPPDPEDWGWWTYAAGEWRPATAPTPTGISPGTVITFDANEVSDA